MCRYGLKTYNTHFACFACRKVFRKRADGTSARIDRCPDCGAEMAALGMDLRAPRRNATRQWRVLEGMFAVGHAFQTCGCVGPGLIPASTSEYKRYLSDALARYREGLHYARDAAERVYWAGRIARVSVALAG